MYRFLNLLILTILLYGSSHVQAAPKKSTKVSTPEKTFSALIHAADKGGGVIELTPTTYKRFVDVANRNYTMILQLTSLQGKYMCPECASARADLQLLVDEYLAKISYDYASEAFLKTPVFFGVYEYSERSADDFRRFQLRDIPHLAVLRPGKSATMNIGAESSTAHTAEEMATVIRRGARIKLTPRRPLGPQIVYYGSIVVTAYFMLVYILPFFYSNMFTPVVPYTLSLVVFAVVMAGTVYNLIRSPPFIGRDRYTGGPKFIDGSGRSQFVLEGIIVAVLMTVLGVVHVLINASADTKRAAWQQRALFYALAIIYVCVLNMIFQLFYIKYSFYPYQWKLFDMLKSAGPGFSGGR